MKYCAMIKGCNHKGKHILYYELKKETMPRVVITIAALQEQQHFTALKNKHGEVWHQELKYTMSDYKRKN